MSRVAHESRSRIAIDWYDSLAEARQAAANLKTEYTPSELADASIGIAQCGRDPGFDRTVNGVRQYAVVTP
jgi:hypothetical protein